MNSNNELQYQLEIARAFVAYSILALKSIILINGGAAVALLAFMGNIWVKNTAPAVTSLLTKSIACFACGVLTGAFSAATTYLTQWLYSTSWNRFGKVVHIFTYIIIILSFVLFGMGIYKASVAFNLHFK